jgi:cell division protein FtsN
MAEAKPQRKAPAKTTPKRATASSKAKSTTAKKAPAAKKATAAKATAAKKTRTTKKAGKKHVQVAAVTPAAAAPVARQGKYKVHIAALRSRAEAEALAAQLVAQHGADLANHAPTVDEAVIGSMGTFYRVRIGGYASQDEPRGLCNKLRTSGLDCLVVTN